MHRIEDGINAVRVVLPKCWFDASKCARGIEALKLYRSEWDETLKVLRPRPVHDWTSHAADAFRYLAMTLDGKARMSGFHRRTAKRPDLLRGGGPESAHPVATGRDAQRHPH